MQYGYLQLKIFRGWFTASFILRIHLQTTTDIGLRFIPRYRDVIRFQSLDYFESHGCETIDTASRRTILGREVGHGVVAPIKHTFTVYDNEAFTIDDFRIVHLLSIAYLVV